MTDNNEKIENRLKNMKNFYVKAGKMIDKLPESIPEKTREMLKEKILGDKDLKNLMEGLENHRPPRIFLIGRTGVGKSSLINAICGSYVAKVSDTVSCTTGANIYQCKDGDRVLMEILDTRGIAESASLDETTTAEEALINSIKEFSPDVAIMMFNCTRRDDVDSDIEFLKRVAKEYADINSVRLPIVAVINKCDEMAPSRKKEPSEYPSSKIEKIKEMVQYYKAIIMKHALKVDDIVPVASLIDWQTPDGEEIGTEDIENLPEHDIENLQIAFDGRYKIGDLLDILEKAILDFEAQMGLRMAARLNEVVHRIAKQICNVFSGISATVALSPIPLSDIYILSVLQVIMVTLIASLSGRDIDMSSAKEFIVSMGGVVGAGCVFRLIAQQTSKLLNGILPGSGSAVSSAVATTGTLSIGKAAISYYIDDKTIDEAKKIFVKNQKESE